MKSMRIDHCRFSLLVTAAAAMCCLPAQYGIAATLSLANAPLATMSSGNVKPNLMYILDDSGSMNWDYLPDEAGSGGGGPGGGSGGSGSYGYKSYQCNGVAYNPSTSYTPPVAADGTSYPNAMFSAAWSDGFASVTAVTSSSSSLTIATGSVTAVVASATGFRVNSFVILTAENGSGSMSGLVTAVSGTSITVAVSAVSGSGTAASWSVAVASSTGTNLSNSTYYRYTGSQPAMSWTYTTNGVDTTTTFYQECTTQTTSTSTVFTAVTMTSASADAQNYANWYSYYRKRLLMMKTAVSQAFKAVDNRFRVGFTTISDTGTTDGSTFLHIDDFTSAQKALWYSKLLAIQTSGTTPLRGALSKIGQMYAGRFSNADPVQYSCQQNFTIMSTDGYWNTGDESNTYGPYDVLGNAVGQQDGDKVATPPPMWDGAQSATQQTASCTQDTYSLQNRNSSGNRCSSGQRAVSIVHETGTESILTVNGVAGSPTYSWNSGSATTTYLNNGNCSATYTSTWLSTNYPVNPVVSCGALSGSTPTTAGGSSNSLADVAMYYYQTDLRTDKSVASGGTCTGPGPCLNNCANASGLNPGVDLCANNVYTTSTDSATTQHMTTFTLGLGLSGLVKYDANYLAETSSSTIKDFYNISQGTANWPDPQTTSSGTSVIERVDDLWHAAVDGHGQYFSAKNPTALVTGLNTALEGISSRMGYGAGAATSNLEPVAGDNYVFVGSYTTGSWTGNLRALTIDASGVVSRAATWCFDDIAADPVSGTSKCTGVIKTQVGASADTRNIYAFDSTQTNKLRSFIWANLTATEQTWFATNQLSQYSTTYAAADKTAATGASLLNYLRGQSGYENAQGNPNLLYRARSSVVGDIVGSVPTYEHIPLYFYQDAGYSAFKAIARAPTVFVGANDGMLHAISADTTGATGMLVAGTERWAYVPGPVMRNMYAIADFTYAVNHQFYVDAPAQQLDVCVSPCAAATDWRTIIVAGLNAGGRGYYALDVTDPTTPKALWEFTSADDSDVGYTYGKPVAVKLASGRWVILATSGYNNVSPGSGGGFLFVLDPITGTVISKIATGVGSTTTPSGLAQVSASATRPAYDATALYVYGGDMAGNLWRFDINNGTATTGTGSVMKLAVLTDPSGVGQPVTTRPIIANIGGSTLVIVGTGKYLEKSDLTSTQVQSLYAIKDTGSLLPAFTTGANRTGGNLVMQTIVNNGSTRTIPSPAAVDLATTRGWYLDFPESGERDNVDMLLIQNTLLVATNIPDSATACTAGGRSWLNYFNVGSGGPLDTTNVVGQSFANDMITGLNVVWLTSTKWEVVPDLSGGGPSKPPVALPSGSSIPNTVGRHVSWREIVPAE